MAHLLRIATESPWQNHLVLRGSLLLKAWLGAAAREPGDMDWVVTPPTLRMADLLARYPNMWIKLSDLPPYAGPNWTPADLRPYIEATLDAFGPGRTIYAGDYPILLQSTSLTEWVEVLDDAFADLGLTEAETRAIYRDNAVKFYRLDL